MSAKSARDAPRRSLTGVLPSPCGTTAPPRDGARKLSISSRRAFLDFCPCRGPLFFPPGRPGPPGRPAPGPPPGRPAPGPPAVVGAPLRLGAPVEDVYPPPPPLAGREEDGEP